MNTTTDEHRADEDPRLLEAARAYLAELEAGRRPDRRAFAGKYAELGEALAPYLDALDAVHGAAPLLQASGPARVSAEALPAEPLGDFRIERELGRGGMGVVYEAVQLSLGRKVALKVLPFAAALNATQLQRFKNEAQAAAQLHHAHIVPVYGVGCERGVHYYAMQLIEGHNLAALIEEMRPVGPPRPGADPTGPYPPPPSSLRPGETRGLAAGQFSTLRSERASEFFRTAARLAAQAADALHYAHQMGIVHRDVKPANILLDGRGDAWVTDFGLAHVQADAGLTQTGDLVGTLRYMSPEQATGGRALLDHRTDVYSLGATLYELLTRRPIFEAADRPGLLRQILHDEPRPPRGHDRAIPEELETIVLKAVAKAPAERYASARELADDLERFLDHRPILARRATLMQRARKWFRRHPSVAVAAVVLLVLLAAGSLLSAWLIQKEKARTVEEYERAELRARQAEERLKLARRSADEMFLLAEDEMADRPQLQAVRKRLLEAALAYYGELLEQSRDDAGARAELDTARRRVEKVIADLKELEGAGKWIHLGREAVRDDLGMTEAQRERLAAVMKRLGEKGLDFGREFHKLSADQRRARLLAMARENEAALQPILTPGQVARLGQIDLQVKGPHAFRESDVVAKLKLTSAQRKDIRAIVDPDVMFGPPGPPPRGGKGGGRHGGPMSKGAKPPFGPEWREEAMRRVLDLLSDEQRKGWRELIGEPYTGPMWFFKPGGGPPPRG